MVFVKQSRRAGTATMQPRLALSSAERGIALGRARRKSPWSNPEALKGRDKRTHLLRPFRAWAEAGPSKPRALPWAMLCEAFGLKRRPALVA